MPLRLPDCQLARFGELHPLDNDHAGHTHKRPDYFRNRGVFIKEGGFLLSRIALQYHRRKWA